MTEHPHGKLSSGVRAMLAGLVLLSLVLAGLLVTRARSGEIVNATDGSVLVMIEGGVYTIGTATADLDTLLADVRRKRPDFPRHELEDETPAHTVTLPAFLIGRHEVTNAQYRRFVAAVGTASATSKLWEEAAKKNGESAPVVQVSWEDAQAYCRWAGVRLPTEEEWEAAARGTEGRKFPWGTDADPTRCHCSASTRLNAPMAVGTLPRGDTPQGVSDMAGNVWEWTASRYTSYPGSTNATNHDFRLLNRVIRGGSFNTASMEMLRGAHRYRDDPRYCAHNLGFRVAKDR